MGSISRGTEVVGIERLVPMCGSLLRPNGMAGLGSATNLQRFGLERFHSRRACLCKTL